jgi:branched-chain amino acid aminotransferase
MDGQLTPWAEAPTHVLSHGLRYGGFCFEGIRAYSGQPFAREAHLDRFLRSAEILGMPLPWNARGAGRGGRGNGQGQ